MKVPLLIGVTLAFGGILTRGSDITEWEKLQREGNSGVRRASLHAAAKAFTKAAEKAETFGKDDARYAESLRGMGFVAMETGNFNGADFAFTRLTRIDGLLYGTNDLLVAQDLIVLTELSSRTGPSTRGDESIPAAEAIIRQKAGTNSPEMGYCIATRASLEAAEDHLPQAEKHFQEALAILDRDGTEAHFRGSGSFPKEFEVKSPRFYLFLVLNNYGLCQENEKKFQEAKATFQRAIKIVEKEYGTTSVALIELYYNLGRTESMAHETREAEKTLRRAYLLSGGSLNPGPLGEQIRKLLVEVLKNDGKTYEASLYQ